MPGVRAALALVMLALAFLATGCGDDESERTSSPSERTAPVAGSSGERDRGQDDAFDSDDNRNSGSGRRASDDTSRGDSPPAAGPADEPPGDRGPPADSPGDPPPEDDPPEPPPDEPPPDEPPPDEPPPPPPPPPPAPEDGSAGDE